MAMTQMLRKENREGIVIYEIIIILCECNESGWLDGRDKKVAHRSYLQSQKVSRLADFVAISLPLKLFIHSLI